MSTGRIAFNLTSIPNERKDNADDISLHQRRDPLHLGFFALEVSDGPQEFLKDVGAVSWLGSI